MSTGTAAFDASKHAGFVETMLDLCRSEHVGLCGGKLDGER